MLVVEEVEVILQRRQVLEVQEVEEMVELPQELQQVLVQ